jgi:hypothetical protein
VRITTQQGSSLIAENVNGLTIDGFTTLRSHADKPIVSLTNVQNVFLYNCNVSQETPVFLQVKGEKTKNITLKNNNFKLALKSLVKDESVQEEIVVD